MMLEEAPRTSLEKYENEMVGHNGNDPCSSGVCCGLSLDAAC